MVAPGKLQNYCISTVKLIKIHATTEKQWAVVAVYKRCDLHANFSTFYCTKRKSMFSVTGHNQWGDWKDP